MNITIFPNGKGGAASAVNYLLSDLDHEGKKRSVMPEIISGDPDTFTAIANATNRLHKYTSGVIAFRDQETLTLEQVSTLIDTFRATFLPGLRLDENFADFWVMHRDKGNLELHFLVANTELTTGQQLNIHPPGEKNIQFFNAFSAVMNDTFGFAQVVPDPLKIALKPFEAKSPSGKKNKKVKNDFAKVLHAEITNGFIADRNALIGFMKRSGIDVQKIGSDFITVRLPGAQKNTRLKGPLFTKNSNYAELVRQHHQSKIQTFLTPLEAQEQKDKLVAGIEARAAFNQRRYISPKPGANRNRASAMPSDTATVVTLNPVKVQPLPNKTSTILASQLTALKEQADPAISNPAAHLPHHVARRQDEREQATALPSVTGAALCGLETQIGYLSMQYYTLLITLASATGRRASLLKAQIMTIEQKLSSLNLELQRKKAQSQSDPAKPKN
jgi:hypothetical protein